MPKPLPTTPYPGFLCPYSQVPPRRSTNIQGASRGRGGWSWNSRGCTKSWNLPRFVSSAFNSQNSTSMGIFPGSSGSGSDSPVSQGKKFPSSEISNPTKSRRIRWDFPTLRHREPLAQGFVQVKTHTKKKKKKQQKAHFTLGSFPQGTRGIPKGGILGFPAPKNCGKRMGWARCHPKKHSWVRGQLQGHIPAPEIPNGNIPGRGTRILDPKNPSLAADPPWERLKDGIWFGKDGI